MKIQEFIDLNTKKLVPQIDEANLKIKIILMNVFNVSKEYLMIHGEEEIPEEKINEIEEKISRLENKEPIQYIVNNQIFFGMDFYVDKNVLIPQPDTEVLVEECLNILKNNEEKNIKVLDLCTGSGAIGISLAKNNTNLQVTASDISIEALKIAEKNATKNRANVKFILSNLFDEIKEKYFIIVSNPPYIETSTIENLSEEVKKEPMLALDGGQDGLDFYRKIAKESKSFLENCGYLALEIGYNQKESVEEILKLEGYKNIYSKQDYAGNNRIVIAQK